MLKENVLIAGRFLRKALLLKVRHTVYSSVRPRPIKKRVQARTSALLFCNVRCGGSLYATDFCSHLNRPTLRYRERERERESPQCAESGDLKLCFNALRPMMASLHGQWQSNQRATLDGTEERQASGTHLEAFRTATH